MSQKIAIVANVPLIPHSILAGRFSQHYIWISIMFQLLISLQHSTSGQYWLEFRANLRYLQKVADLLATIKPVPC